jgi:hypothetical protein
MYAGLPLFKQRFGPRLVRDVIDLQVRCKVRRLSIICVVGFPNSRQIRLAISQPRWGCRKVRLANGRPRDFGRRHFGPLCLKRCRHQNKDCNRNSDYCLQSSFLKLLLIIGYSLSGISPDQRSCHPNSCHDFSGVVLVASGFCGASNRAAHGRNNRATQGKLVFRFDQITAETKD